MSGAASPVSFVSSAPAVYRAERLGTAELVLLLSETPGLGERGLASVLSRNAVLRREPEEFLRLPAERLREEYGLRREAAEAIGRVTPALRKAAAESARSLRLAGIRLLTTLDATYPARLLQRLEEPPPVLYAYGNLRLLDRPTFAVANSNGASEVALAAGERAAERAMGEGAVPVTGHNRPAYQRTALVARRNGGAVCYVLDRGMLEAFGGDQGRDLFPAARIWSLAYDPDRDLTLSPFPPPAHGLGAHNRKRDRLLFALADAVHAGDVRPGGQMERVCLQALAQGQPVFLLTQPYNAALLDAGAQTL